MRTILKILIMLVGVFTYAQTTVSGSITDQNNQPLIGCNIMIKGTYLGAATNLNGEYFILNIPPGTYDVTASMIGFGSVTVEGTVVMVCLLYTSPSPRDTSSSRMPSSA